MIKKLFKIIFSDKILFQNTPKREILFYSDNTFSLIGDKFNKKKIFVVHNNIEKSLYFFPFIKSVILKLFKWKPKHYFYYIIEKVKPKYFITIIDNDINLFDFKRRYPEITFIVIQNGYRYDTNYDDYFKKLNKLEKKKI